VGVVNDLKSFQLHEPVLPQAYIPYTFSGFGDRSLLVRTVTNPALLVNDLRQVLSDVDPNTVLVHPETLEDQLNKFVYMKPKFRLISFPHLRGYWSRTGADWSVRRDGLLRHVADSRIGCSHGARRTVRQHSHAGPEQGNLTRREWRIIGLHYVISYGTRFAIATVGDVGLRSVDACSGSGCFTGDRLVGVLSTSTSGYSGGFHDRSALRIEIALHTVLGLGRAARPIVSSDRRSAASRPRNSVHQLCAKLTRALW